MFVSHTNSQTIVTPAHIDSSNKLHTQRTLNQVIDYQPPIFIVDYCHQASKNETGGGEGVEVVQNEPFENAELGKGQFTHKIYHLARYVSICMYIAKRQSACEGFNVDRSCCISLVQDIFLVVLTSQNGGLRIDFSTCLCL